MKRKLSLISLLVGLLVISSFNVYAGSGTSYGELQTVKVFFNNSGGTLSCGQVVVIDRTGTGVSAGTTLGAYVTTTTTADVSGVVGVVRAAAVDQEPVVVVIEGPALTQVLDSSDAVSTNTMVGTSTTAGKAGAFSNAQAYAGTLGYAMEPGAGTDDCAIWVWVRPK